MQTSTRIRVLIHSRGAGADLLRTLVSLGGQSIGPKRLNIILASTTPAEHATREFALLHSALGFNSLEILDASRLHPMKALNAAALDGHEEWLALVPEGTRLSPKFMERCLHAGAATMVQAVYPAHTAGTPQTTPLVRVRAFSPEQLVRSNPVGPVALVRRQGWELMGGLRPGVQLALWDFWLRLAVAGGTIVRVPELLASCCPLPDLPRWQDGQAKALLVVATPGVFEADVCRWAMALLRGDHWAEAFEPGCIPSARDVRAMFAGFSAPLRPAHAAWGAGSARTA